MRPSTRLTIALLGLALASAASGCGGSNHDATAQTSKNGFNPPPPTLGTPNPANVIQSLDDAIANATSEFVGRSGDPASASHVQSLAYVQTTAGRAGALVRQWIDPGLANNTAWLFVEQGDFQHFGFTNATPGPVKHTLWVRAIQGETTVISSGSSQDDQRVTLSSLGAPIVIPPGRIPKVDAIRAPALPAGAATIAVGAASLVAGKCRCR
jgi:hypothetical protein